MKNRLPWRKIYCGNFKLFRNLAGRADLEPGSQQLLVGGIGSGKTTELMLAAQWFRTQGDGLALYIDVTAETDLSGLNSGALFASFGLHLARRLAHGSDSAVKVKEVRPKNQGLCVRKARNGEVGRPVASAASMFQEAERLGIIDALRAASCGISGKGGAAERLGLKRTTLQNKMA